MTSLRAPSFASLRTFVAAVGLVALAGCATKGCGESTIGALGRATFAYVEAQGCFFGCGVDKALMLGTTEELAVRGDNLPPNLTLVSTNPGIALMQTSHSQTCCVKSGNSTTCNTTDGSGATCEGTLSDEYRASILATQKGSGSFVLQQSNGEIVDSVFVQVEEAAAIDVSCAPPGSSAQQSPSISEIVLASGTQCELSAMPKDADGHEMHASTGFHYQVSDSSIVDVSSDFGDTGANRVNVHGLNHGKATLRVAGGTVTREVPVTVQ